MNKATSVNTNSTASASKSQHTSIEAKDKSQVQQMMEDRHKEQMKILTRNLEVCDLLDMRNPQSVAEFAPAVYKHLFK